MTSGDAVFSSQAREKLVIGQVRFRQHGKGDLIQQNTSRGVSHAAMTVHKGTTLPVASIGYNHECGQDAHSIGKYQKVDDGEE
jgi:hypothetical protein